MYPKKTHQLQLAAWFLFHSEPQTPVKLGSVVPFSGPQQLPLSACRQSLFELLLLPVKQKNKKHEVKIESEVNLIDVTLIECKPCLLFVFATSAIFMVHPGVHVVRVIFQLFFLTTFAFAFALAAAALGFLPGFPLAFALAFALHFALALLAGFPADFAVAASFFDLPPLPLPFGTGTSDLGFQWNIWDYRWMCVCVRDTQGGCLSNWLTEHRTPAPAFLPPGWERNNMEMLGNLGSKFKCEQEILGNRTALTSLAWAKPRPLPSAMACQPHLVF